MVETEAERRTIWLAVSRLEGVWVVGREALSFLLERADDSSTPCRESDERVLVSSGEGAATRAGDE